MDAALARLHALEDRFAIADLMERYCTTLDERDWAGFRAVFTDDVRVHYGAMYGTSLGGDQHAAMVAGIAEREFAVYQHYVSNLAVEVDGDTATGRAFLFFAVELASHPGEQLFSGGRYRVRFTRTADGWRIAELVILPQWAHPKYQAVVAAQDKR